MEMDDVEAFTAKNLEDASFLQPRSAGLMREQWRQPPEATSQRVDRDVGMRGNSCFGVPGVLKMIRVNTVNHINMMTMITKCMGQAVKVNGIPAKAVRRIECCQVQNIQKQKLSVRLIHYRGVSSECSCGARDANLFDCDGIAQHGNS